MNIIEVDAEESCEPPPWLDQATPFIQAALTRLGIHHWELSILFCKDPFMAELNAKYRDVEGPTDVLSFAIGQEYTAETGERRYSAGDIVISLDTLAQNAAYFHVTPDEELKRLLVHGILHLAGYDHSGHIDDGAREEEPEEEMLRLQEGLLTDLRDYSIIKV